MDVEYMALPAPETAGSMSLEEALARRESVRGFSGDALDLKEISQLLWAGQGRTRSWGARTAPSAGALFPLELYLITRKGIHCYNPDKHCLLRKSGGDVLGKVAEAAFGQELFRKAAAVFLIAAVPSRTEKKYGSRSQRYIAMEAGHAAQNILLQAVSMDLGAVPIGAFDDNRVNQAIQLPPGQVAVYMVAVGRLSKK